MGARFALFPAVAVILAIAVSASTARAAEKVWSGLVMAENVPQPHPVPAPLESIEKTLVALFGYNQFDVIGESNKSLKTGEEDWLAASKYFSLKVDARGETESGYELNLKLFQDQQILVETDTKLSKQSPLVIKGPQVGSGQLLLVLIVADDAKDEGQTVRRRHRREPDGVITSAWRRVTRLLRKVGP